ncbi:MAG TPA: molecular chaperone DjiA [Albidovulum sp.]|uniref:TerB family tellurite resistance protein n=1 Tax=Albidovulum sp. TaxID=1872424 RepID=UPI002B5091D2|nr:molecular chaperone DjiA [Albidovulum sp.]
MSLWTRITAAIAALAKGEPLSAVFDHLRTPPEKSIGFTIAVIALGAKMAKADGEVTRNEVMAFRSIFSIPKDEEQNAARVFNLARQDVAGFDLYARKIAAMFGPDHAVLADLMEGLFHIALADGEYHPHEDAFLREVARIFGIGDRCFRSLVGRLVPGAVPDPYDVLDVPPDAPIAAVRAAWRQAVKENHPDRLISHGLPQEAMRLAEERMAAINRAWEEINGKKAA